MARLLLNQLDQTELEKAQVISVGHARRWLRRRRAGEDVPGRCPSEPRNAFTVRTNIGSGGMGGGGGGACARESTACSEREPNRDFCGCVSCRDRHCCPSCGLVVLGHPLDAISSGCGKLFSCQWQKDRSVAAGSKNAVDTSTTTTTTPGVERLTGLNSQSKAAGGKGTGPPRGGARKRGTRVGAAVVEAVLGGEAVEMVARQLGSLVELRCQPQIVSVAMLAEAEARAKKVRSSFPRCEACAHSLRVKPPDPSLFDWLVHFWL